MNTKYPKTQKRDFSLILILILIVFQQTVFAQIHPGTGGSTPCANCVPSGWTLDAGSPDISDATQWGYNAAPWNKTIPPIPNGETSFLSAHSTEVASMLISGLTAGSSYTLVFYYMAATNSQPVLGGYGSLLSPVVRYSMDGGSVVQLNVATEATWYSENIVFTASGTTAKFTFYGGSHDGFFPGSGSTEGDLTSISFAPNSVVPTTGTPPPPPPPACSIPITVNSASICSGESVTLYATGGASYQWSTGSHADSIIVSPTNTTSYIVTGTNAGCSGTASARVTVVPKPKAGFDYDPRSAGAMDPVITFTDRSSSDVTYWSWNFGDGNTVSSLAKSQVHGYSKNDSSYVVTLLVRNAANCESSITHTITINKEFTFYMPNAFSPNNDDLNDEFGPKGNGIENFRLSIFDRWGMLIFTSNELNTNWNGNVKGGAIAQQDVYVWKVKLTDVLKREHNLIGRVTLVR